MYKVKPRLQPQFNACERDRIPLSIIIGEDEIAKGVVKLKSMTSKEGNEGGDMIERKDLVRVIKEKLGL
jgi:histidyl-tRNA synthetase